MGKFENEVKVLDVNPVEIDQKLKALGAKLLSSATQKIYVYDLADLYTRYTDCMHLLKNCKMNYQYEVVRSKLRGILNEIDNLLTTEQRNDLESKTHEERLVDLLEKTPSDKLMEVFEEDDIQTLISEFGINRNKWVRLRDTNGKTTLTVKHILNTENLAIGNNDFQPVLETEIQVPSLEEGNAMLEQLGFAYRNYQEKKRTSYNLDGVEIDIDSWPLIPSYMEIEHDSMETIKSIIHKLGLDSKEVVSCNTQDVYRKYGIDIYQYRTLAFDSEIEKDEEPEL